MDILRTSFTNAAALLCIGLFASCGEPSPKDLPIINTPASGKVNLSKVTLAVSDAAITVNEKGEYQVSFNYTIHNQAGAHISFLCLYTEPDDLIDVQLKHKVDDEEKLLILGKRPLDGLTLPEPRPLQLSAGKSTRRYTVPVSPGTIKSGEPLTLRVRLHAPSRYDELRSSIEAPTIHLLWP